MSDHLDAFYEWQHRGKEKIKYKIGFDDELFALAGIYNLIDDRIYYSMITPKHGVSCGKSTHQTQNAICIERRL